MSVFEKPKLKVYGRNTFLCGVAVLERRRFFEPIGHG